MAGENCSDVFDCENAMSLEQALRNMIVKDDNGCPVLKTKDVNAIGNVPNSALSSALIESAEAEGSKTLAGLYTAFTTWKTTNSSKTIISTISVMGGNGVPGIIVLYK